MVSRAGGFFFPSLYFSRGGEEKKRESEDKRDGEEEGAQTGFPAAHGAVPDSRRGHWNKWAQFHIL